MIITIDGPAASGKSSTARALAEKLQLCHINSGLLFRALAYLLIDEKGYDSLTIVNPQQHDVDTYLDPARLIYQCNGDHAAVLFDGKDLTPQLRGTEISNGASIVSTNAYVREKLLAVQRAIAQQYDCIVDGRDSGSVVFPNADVKFYLTASLQKRAQRWQHEQELLGNHYTLHQAQDQIALRDARDVGRAVAPLIVPDGAIVIDNSEMTSEQTIERMVSEIGNRKINS